MTRLQLICHIRHHIHLLHLLSGLGSKSYRILLLRGLETLADLANIGWAPVHHLRDVGVRLPPVAEGGSADGAIAQNGDDRLLLFSGILHEVCCRFQF